MDNKDRKQQIVDIIKDYAEGNYHLDITEHDLHIAADRIVKLFAIPAVIKSGCSLRNKTICKYRLYDNECHCKEDCDFKQAVL